MRELLDPALLTGYRRLMSDVKYVYTTNNSIVIRVSVMSFRSGAMSPASRLRVRSPDGAPLVVATVNDRPIAGCRMPDAGYGSRPAEEQDSPARTSTARAHQSRGRRAVARPAAE